jgi:transcriptional regulator with XRE-family HTH domain
MPRTRVTNGPAITARREQLGILQKDLAERIGVSGSYLSRIESGVETPGPTARAVRALMTELGATLDDLTVPAPDAVTV